MFASKPRLPAEWEPQAGILIAWPHADTDWAPRLTDVETTLVALAVAVARFEPVVICVADGALRIHAHRLLLAAGVDGANLRYVEIGYDDTWLRDSGPITLVDADGFVLTDFHFTGWGGKFEAGQDDRLIEGLVEREVFARATHQRIDWALEGGAIESDGAGTILTTWKCLTQRHPQQSRTAMTMQLKQSLYADRILWLEHGYLEGDDTDAHVDTLARFAPDDAIVYQACDDESDSHHAELSAMANELAALRTCDGNPYTLHALPWPEPILDETRRLAASYANYLIVNGAVLVPAYDCATDEEAARIIGLAHPGREIVSVPCRSLIWQNGSLHCQTMQLPAGVLAN
ncbi:MAG: agmatine deiminase family protein [Dokdonella sp.]